MGQATYSQVRQEFEQRVRHGEFRLVGRSDGRAARQYTTAEMIRLEREIVGLVQKGNESRYESSMLVSPVLRIRIEDAHRELSKSQLAAVDEIFLTREKIVGLDGVAGAGKTTTLSVIREGVEAQGYRVEGFAPTSRAAQKLAEAGVMSWTLQHHLAKGVQPDTGEKRLYVLDESSLASTRQMHEFLSRLHQKDRVLLVGDVRQHEGVEAGRPFAQLQEAGMHTVKLDEILRQRDPELKESVEMLARGNVASAIESLDIQGRVHQVVGRDARIGTIAREYAACQRTRWSSRPTIAPAPRSTARFIGSCKRTASLASRSIGCKCLRRARS
jgi:ATP-dependent exoDNAse (exonuclease V) alpha subunit